MRSLTICSTLLCTLLVSLYIQSMNFIQEKAGDAFKSKSAASFEYLHRDVVINILFPLIFNPDEYALQVNPSYFCGYHNKKVRYASLNMSNAKDLYTHERLKDLNNFGGTCRYFYMLKKEYLKKMQLVNPRKEIELLYQIPCDSYKLPPMKLLLRKQARKQPYITPLALGNNEQECYQVRLQTRQALIELIRNDPYGLFQLSQEKLLYTLVLILQFMREHNFDINEQFPGNQHLPLTTAWRSRNSAAFKLLLLAGADITKKQRFMWDGCHEHTVLDDMRYTIKSALWKYPLYEQEAIKKIHAIAIHEMATRAPTQAIVVSRQPRSGVAQKLKTAFTDFVLKKVVHVLNCQKLLS
jgi:hypothetical protein